MLPRKKPVLLASAGCAFATSYCATVLGHTPSAISLSEGFQAITSPPTVGTFTGSFYTQPTSFRLGTVRQYNVDVEQQLPGKIVLTAGYAGSRGNHILVAGNDPSIPGVPQPVSDRLLIP